MVDTFRGRTSELKTLDGKYKKDGFVMTILYGRRRVGKTELINKFMEEHDCLHISFTAVEREESELLSLMTESVLMALAPELLDNISFNSFEKLFEYVGKRAEKERIIFFIDEYPYLAKKCPYIQSVLQKIIDTQWKKGKLFFILCGSFVSFMKEEVIGKEAPLHGRSDLELRLRPFNYLETAEFLDGYSNEEKAICYGLTNGVAKYVVQFNPKLSLEENIIEQFYSVGGYFTEEQVKTVITSDKQDPALYNTIISAVATGYTKNSEIATYIGSDDVTYPLKTLVGAELLEKRMSKKPYYVLNDSMIQFWFKYVNRATSLINAGRGEVYYRSNVKEHLHDFMGKVFEKMAKEYLMMNAGNKGLPILTEITDYQASVIDSEKKQRQIEIDLLGKSDKNIMLVGECKFKNTSFGKEEYENLMDKIKYLPVTDPTVCIFSLSGFTDYVKKNASKCRLISLDDMYSR
ncbi:MAG: AAA family ATPase [Lachnospiraceae bacterium]|nr:AAA family ATPase [Lachnospiraceae bacterium]